MVNLCQLIKGKMNNMYIGNVKSKSKQSRIVKHMLECSVLIELSKSIFQFLGDKND